MILGRVGEVVEEDFTVADSNNVLVPGINVSSFSLHLFNPDGNEVSSTVPHTFNELGYGHYRCSFYPDKVGTWYVSSYHTTYFPWGKTGSVQVFSNDFDTIASIVTRILGLSQENFHIGNPIYDENCNLLSSTIKTYSNAGSVGTNNNIIAEYEVTATYVDNKLETYKVIKV